MPRRFANDEAQIKNPPKPKTTTANQKGPGGDLPTCLAIGQLPSSAIALLPAGHAQAMFGQVEVRDQDTQARLDVVEVANRDFYLTL